MIQNSVVREYTLIDTVKVTARDEALLFAALFAACSSFEDRDEIRVLKNPIFDFTNDDGAYSHAELCDALIITNSQIIMFEMKTRCSTRISDSWMRTKPFDARKQSHSAAMHYLEGNGSLLDIADNKNVLNGKSWSHFTVLNSIIPNSLRFIESISDSSHFEPNRFFQRTKTITLQELRTASEVVTDVNDLFYIPSVMDIG